MISLSRTGLTIRFSAGGSRKIHPPTSQRTFPLIPERQLDSNALLKEECHLPAAGLLRAGGALMFCLKFLTETPKFQTEFVFGWELGLLSGRHAAYWKEPLTRKEIGRGPRRITPQSNTVRSIEAPAPNERLEIISSHLKLFCSTETLPSREPAAVQRTVNVGVNAESYDTSRTGSTTKMFR